MQTRAAPLRIDAPPAPAPPRYQVDVLTWAEVGGHGVSHLNGSRREILQWASVLYAAAAEVGEPEGVFTVVFDLVVERKGRDCVVCRFDAEPGRGAEEAAVKIATGLGRSRCSRSLLALASDGTASLQVPDLEALAEQVRAELGS